MTEDREIIGWDAYDKSPIYDGEPFVVEGDLMYHLANFKQKNTYYDPFEE